MRANQNTALRTPETWKRYQNAPKLEGCFLCTESGDIVKRYKFWFIVENAYPYDAVAEIHHMLVPKEHMCNEEGLTEAMTDEANEIMEELEEKGVYDCFMRNLTVAQSHPTHLHYHLLKWKRT